MVRKIAIFGVILFLLLLLVPSASAYWNNSYYKTPLLVNNTGYAAILTDFQVLVNITYNASYMDSEFTSFHLVNETLGTEMVGRFWINRNSTVNGSYANIVLNISIPASAWDNTTYALYHRTTAEIDSSNGTKTYVFFDDCGNGVNANKWTVNQSASGNVKCSNSKMSITGDNTWGGNRIVSVPTFTNPYILEFENSQGNTAGFGLAGAFNSGTPDASGDGIWQRFTDVSGYAVIRNTTISDYSGGTYIAGIQYGAKFVYEGRWHTFLRNGTVLTNTTTNVPSSYLIFNEYTSAGFHNISNIRVRKYASTEPIIKFGAIQSGTAINIISWGNNYTNNQNLSLSVLQGTIVNFNITNNSVAVDYYNATVNGIDQNNNYNNYSLVASSLAGYTVTLSATNLTEPSTASKTWIVSVTVPPWTGGEGTITNDTVFRLGNGANITILAVQNFTRITLFNSSEIPPYTLQFLINASRIRFNSSTNKTISNISYYPQQINGSRGWNFTWNAGSGYANITTELPVPLMNYSIYRNGTTWVARATTNASGWLSYNITGEGDYSIQRDQGKPYLITPANNSDVATTTIAFTWSNESSTQYNIQVARDSAFTIIDTNTNVATNSTSIEVLFLTNYYWRVRTYNGVATYGEWSEQFTFEATTYTLPTSDGSTGIHGYVFEVKSTGNVRVSNAIVSISNTTWTSATTTDSNGYYLFKGLANNTLYTLQATKPNYENSATELVTTVNGIWSIKHIYMQACVSGLNCFYTQEYQTIIVYYANTSPVLDATVTIYRDSAKVENKLTDSSGATKFLLTKDIRYQATATKLSEGILQSEFFYTSPIPLIIIVGTLPYATPNATPHTNITTYNQTSTTKTWSVQNFTSQYLTSQIGLGTMGQGVVAGTVNWVVVGAGGWFTTILAGAIMAYLGILAWTTVIFFILTIMSLWVLTRT